MTCNHVPMDSIGVLVDGTSLSRCMLCGAGTASWTSGGRIHVVAEASWPKALHAVWAALLKERSGRQVRWTIGRPVSAGYRNGTTMVASPTE